MANATQATRCNYPGCVRVKRTNDGLCLTCADPSNRPKCQCGADRGYKATWCRSCANHCRSKKDYGTLCNPITPEGMKLLRRGRKAWPTLGDEAKEFRIGSAQDLVKTGLLTEDQSRAEFPSAWNVIDARKAANMIEVSE